MGVAECSTPLPSPPLLLPNPSTSELASAVRYTPLLRRLGASGSASPYKVGYCSTTYG